MKQVMTLLCHQETSQKDDKVDKASVMFVDLFRRIPADSQKEKLTDG